MIGIQNPVLKNTMLKQSLDASDIYSYFIRACFYLIALICLLVWCEMTVSDYWQSKKEAKAREEY
jgi:hypothetical protein